MQFKKYKNLIFDLGGVILNIDESLPVKSFASLSQQSETEILNTMKIPEHRLILQQYEMGKINNRQFRQQLAAFTNASVSDHDFDRAWNSILLDIPPVRIDALLHLKETHRLFLLSNTNDLHHHRFNQIIRDTTKAQNFESLFEKTFYSYQLGMRKPSVEIYEYVLEDSGLRPEETVMLDDLEENLAGARKAGMNTYKVERNHLPLDIFYA